MNPNKIKKIDNLLSREKARQEKQEKRKQARKPKEDK
jgi:hypothetical protein